MDAALNLPDPVRSAHWLNIARELREAGAPREVATECPVPHFAVQDVEATRCEHAVITVRLPGATEQWWHVADKSWCVPGSEYVKGLDDRLIDVSRMGSSRPGDLASDTTAIMSAIRPGPIAMVERQERDLRGSNQECFYCDQRIFWDPIRQRWVHQHSDAWICAIEPAEGEPYRGAWPKAMPT